MKKKNKVIIVILLILVAYISWNYIPEIIFKINYGVSNANEESNPIGNIYLLSSPAFDFSMDRPIGHSWIQIENTSNSPFTIAETIVEPNDSISFGTTAMPRMSHRGIWINVEGYNENYLENIGVSGSFYEEDLIYLEDYLKEHDKWTLLYNCVTFATGIWNNLYVGEEDKYYALTPFGLYKDIIKSDEYILDMEININKKFKPFAID